MYSLRDWCTLESQEPPTLEQVPVQGGWPPRLMCDGAYHDVGGPATERGESYAYSCINCQTDLRPHGMAWRICRCWARLCSHCAAWHCTYCGAPPVAYDDLGHEHWNGNTSQQDQPGSPEGYYEEGDNDACSGGYGQNLAGNSLTSQCREETSGHRGEVHEGRQPSVCLGPRAARQRRDRIIEERISDMATERQRSHKRRNRQIYEGLRPRRRAIDGSRKSFVAINATCASSLIREIKVGSQLQRAGFLLVQEHGLEGEALERHSKELNELGWDVIADRAYRKSGGLGGGTAILVSDAAGIRPVQRMEEKHVGRISLGITSIGVDILIISVYGITSVGIGKQIDLWK